MDSRLEPAVNKRIVLPARIEPKVYFANERTFISWLNFSAVLGGLSISLLHFGDKVGRLSAIGFMAVAMITMCYALYIFHWRATQIRTRGTAPYDDRFGPTCLCACLLTAVLLNFTLRMDKKDEWL